MCGVLRAIAISLALHGVLALGLAAWIGGARKIELATLDLSSVELSFAEEDSEVAPPAPMPPVPPAAEAPRPEERDPPNAPQEPPPPLPPDLSSPQIPETVPEQTPEFDDIPLENPEKQKPVPVKPEPVPVAPSVAPRQAKIDAPARPVKTIRPDYPKGARQRGEEGDVVLEIDISSRGTVKSVKTVRSSGYPELDAAAEKAVRSAPFVPAKSGGGTVPSTARLTVTFKLR